MHIDDDTSDTFDDALTAWGEYAQYEKAIEECGEFIAIMARRLNGRGTTDELVEEIADVLIMMEQMAIIFGEDRVEKQYDRKIRRLDYRLTGLRDESNPDDDTTDGETHE